jgi:biotin-(acetyl-CoA carboxylase) ligase
MDIERLRQRFPDRAIHYFESLPSTMTVAAQLAADGCAHGSAVIAGEQTTGQGRHGRQCLGWQRSLLDLVTSALISASVSGSHARCGTGSLRAIEEVTGWHAMRWPMICC